MNVLTDILGAREQRALLRKEIADTGRASLSLSLNIPGYPKSKPLVEDFFGEIIGELQRYLLAHRIFIDNAYSLPSSKDHAGDFYIVPLQSASPPVEQIKEICEAFETGHLCGRIIDVDITLADNQPLSSGKAKSCFICPDRPAVQCMREKRHSFTQLRETIFQQMRLYLRERQSLKHCNQLSSLAVRSLLYEVSHTPKPGAVDRLTSGSHKDMDFFTFLNSTSALAPHFNSLARSGFHFKGTPQQALPLIRTTGLAMEEEMFDATGGVNTQKGLIFLLGMTVFASAYLIGAKGKLEEAELSEYIKSMNNGLMEKELKTLDLRKNSFTHGEECYRKYGELGGGARYEAQYGFPTVFNHGLPALRAGVGECVSFTREEDIREAMQEALVAIMAVNNDTNILYRKGPEPLERVKGMAREYLEIIEPGLQDTQYNELAQYCRDENISPGGSSDLLALTLFIFFALELEKDRKKK